MTATRGRNWLFLTAYACSGLAGLIYEVSWTRLLTLYMGHTTAAASAVVAAFMGGLAAGAAVGGRVAAKLTRRQCLSAYIALEAFVAFVALVLPLEIAALVPLLSTAYRDGAPGAAFSVVRVSMSFLLMFLPAAALGATFPMAVRWYVRAAERAGRLGGALYAVNTAGASVGALAAGFLLIPRIGVSWTTRVGVAASALTVLAILALLRSPGRDEESDVIAQARLAEAPEARRRSEAPEARSRPDRDDRRRHRRRVREAAKGIATHDVPVLPERPWLAALVLGITGLASLVYEIAWTRTLSMTIGPTIYAFSATLAVLIFGLAVGSAAGAWIAGRVRRPTLWLAFVLAGAALAAAWSCSLAGGAVPRRIAMEVAGAPDTFDRLLTRAAMLVSALILPTAAGLGAAFPLAFATLGGSAQPVSARLGLVYAINTVGAVAGSLLAGFVLIPALGLQQTLRLVGALLVVASLIVCVWGRLSGRARLSGLVAAAAAVVFLVMSPPWDRELLASGAYIYAPYAPKVLDLETALKAGTLLYYREGAAATVSVKRLTGTISLAIDGKVDASTRSDMLTQRLVAHVPLLLHEHPRQICIIGLGSGVTVGAALRHPIEHADVVELSPEVVEASNFFIAQNHRALEDPRTHLIVGDGRSHLLLTKRQYDVIISEPSNPWIAGVASLFTREFFTAARARLLPGGIICQWAHTYNISDRDLRSIVATFLSAFPNGTVWLIGQEDILLVASNDALDARLTNIETGWTRPGVADDLKDVGAVEPFSILSLLVAGPAELKGYTASATVFTDDRSALEFSAPRELHSQDAGVNALNLARLLTPNAGPQALKDAISRAGAPGWRNRAAMMFKSDMFATAYDDYARALTIDSSDAPSLDGFVQSAVMAGRVTDALDRLKPLLGEHPRPGALVAQSRLLAAGRDIEEAINSAKEGREAPAVRAAALEQLATLYADSGKVADLDSTVDQMKRSAPDRAATSYFAAAAAFLHGRFDEAVSLARTAVAADPSYSASYDLAGAAYSKLKQPAQARDAFETSLKYNAHDSSAYANLGLLDLQSGDARAAADQFAEALWLDPDSETARLGLVEAQQRLTR